jgi:Pvc16 N-terminal domain
MSNFRAIATVTATLQRVLQAAVQSDVPGAGVSTVRPSEGANTHLPTTGINLFLYQVAPNPHRSNLDLPTRRSDGDLVQRPQIALDLHYLLSFYGDDLALEPQRLLGSTVAFLHGQPLITRAQIEAAIADNAKPFLANSDLADQPELVRFTPLTISLEELSRLWSVMLQVHYVLSVAYKASVVLVERQVSPRPSLPARTLNLAGVPMRQPYIRQVVAQAGESVPITPGAAVQIEGVDLQGAAVEVDIDDARLTPSSVESDRIKLTLPAALAAGPHSIQIRQGVWIGANSGTRPAYASNLGVFVLQPVITKTGGNYDIAITGVQGAGAAPRLATITVGVAPAVGATQTATLEMLAGQQVAYTFRAQPRASAATQLTFAVTGVTAGDYLFRVRVDGAESPLELDPNRTPTAPKGTIP